MQALRTLPPARQLFPDHSPRAPLLPPPNNPPPHGLQARLKYRDFLSLRALPSPALRLQKRLPIPNSAFGVRLSYECPLDALATFYRPPARRVGRGGVRPTCRRRCWPHGGRACTVQPPHPLPFPTTLPPHPDRLMVHVENFVTAGVRLTQAGLELDAARALNNGSTIVRAAGTVSFPRELPVMEGQPLLGFDVRRLGLKSTW